MDMDLKDILMGQDLLDGLTDEQLDVVVSVAKVVEMGEKERVIQEGDRDDTIFFMVSGEVELKKQTEDRTSEFSIGVHKGENVFGEMSFLEDEPRSASIETIWESEFITVSKADLEAAAGSMLRDIMLAITTNIAQLATRRLRDTNIKYVASLEEEVRHLTERTEFGRMFIATLVLLGLAIIVNHVMGKETMPIDSQSMDFNWVLFVVFVLPISIVILKSKYTFAVFGVTLKGWQDTLIESLVIIITLFALGLFGGLCYEMLTDTKVIKGFPMDVFSKGSTYLSLGAYLVHAFIQELLARGCFQNSLYRFFYPHASYLSIFLTSFLFGALHIHLGLTAVMVTFASGILFGAIYRRHQNLLGVTIVHFVLGSTAFLMGII